MYYVIRHATNYRYSSPICESQMEVRMRPRTEGAQRTWDFRLSTSPRSKISSHIDSLGNTIHHFDIPARHDRLSITMEALVETSEPPALPDSLPPASWIEIDRLADSDEFWEMLQPSHFAKSTPLLTEFATEFGLQRESDPIATIAAIRKAISQGFQYQEKTTRADSPIDEALASRQGVCQDFSHIFIALGRSFGLPCRYVSGYLFHRDDADERSNPDASHAWVEVYLPEIGWIGVDPTNDVVSGERHIRVAVGRDYGDVPPTRGVFKGEAQTETELSVGVRVAPSAAPLPQETSSSTGWMSMSREELLSQHQQQQQQQ
jgi:transglutaminase-like putative cysteine protease